MFPKRKISFRLLLLTKSICVFATFPFWGCSQNNHSFGGSDYAGLTSVYNNPASLANNVYPWEISLLSFQSNSVNNGIVIKNLKLKQLDKIFLSPTTGNKKRFFSNIADLNIFNAHYQLNKNNSIAAGFRYRSYSYVNASPFSCTDTVSNLDGLLHYNVGAQPSTGFNGNLINAAWSEFDFHYSAVVNEDIFNRVTVGVSLQYLKLLSGVFFGLDGIKYQEVNRESIPQFNYINQLNTQFIHPESFNKLDKENSLKTNISNIRKNGNKGIGLSFGLEWVVKNPYQENIEEAGGNYDWKIGISVMDIGKIIANTNKNSFDISMPNDSLTDKSLRSQFENDTKGAYKQILLKNFKQSKPLQPTFDVSLPTKLLVYVDKRIKDNVFVNAQYNYSFYEGDNNNIYDIRTYEINKFSLNLRYEKELWGCNIPLQYLKTGKITGGIAFRYKFVMFGLNNIDWLQKRKWLELNGGIFGCICIRPKATQRHNPLEGLRY